MANNLKVTNLGVNTEATALAALFNSGKLNIYDGTQPATADTAITTQNLLASLTFNATAFGAVSNGLLTANAITSDSDADATGTATWFRAFKSDGTTAIMDGSAGVQVISPPTSFDLNLNAAAIQQHAQVDVTSFTLTVPKS